MPDPPLRLASYSVIALRVAVPLTALLAATGPVAAQCEAGRLIALDAAAGDRFGGAVATSGDLAIIGASRHDALGTSAGAAYAFHREPDGEAGPDVWVEDARLLAPDGARNDLFGSAVAIDADAPGGPVAAVGAYADDHEQGENAGAVYVFRGVPDGSGWRWDFEAKLVAEGGAADDQFGRAVAARGDTIVVGVPRDDERAENAGALHVFRFAGGTWSSVDTLTADDAVAQDQVGTSVAMDADVIVAGAPLRDESGTSDGAAYVYRFEASAWRQETKLLADDAAAGDRFGQAVAVRGDLAVVGAYLDDDGGANAGAAYVFRYDGLWSEPTKLVAAMAAGDDQLGRAVAVQDGPGDDDVVVAGAARADGVESGEGAVHLWVYDGVDWIEGPTLRARDAAADDQLGEAVALGPAGVLAGAGADDHEPAGVDAGSVTVFTVDLDALDCNVNGIPDSCDIAEETSADCDENGIPDECDLEDPDRDRNDNGELDDCEDCNENGVPDGEDLAEGTSADCNENGVPDECDLAAGTSPDCDANEIPDECDLAEGTAADCNENGVPDACDVAAGTSPDCNENGTPDECDVDPDDPDGDGEVSEDCDDGGVPDECEDCNENGVGDTCDVTEGTSQDLNGDGIPDECQDCDGNGLPDFVDILFDPTLDCNGNDVIDECEIPDEKGVCRAETCDPDCNGNGTPDACDIAEGTEDDCDGNGVPDPCDPDCNENGVPDACDVDPEDPDGDGEVSDDANGNGVPDECEDCNGNGVPDGDDIDTGTSLDCNADGVPDECEVPESSGGFCSETCDPDCNENGVPDECDIDGGGSSDFNDNGVPDECEPDCNRNGIPDFLDILFGNSEDADGNGIPDECEVCPPDLNLDGVVDFGDVLIILAAWGPCPDCPEDLDDSDVIDFGDVLIVLGAWGSCAEGGMPFSQGVTAFPIVRDPLFN